MTNSHRAAALLGLCALLAASPLSAQGSRETRIELRPVDRATVRIVALGGARAHVFEGRSQVRRLVGLPRAGHGTGIVVSADGLILTARHVIDGAHLLAVLHPGTNEALPAKVVFVDAAHDLAFIAIPGPTPHFLTIPEQSRVLRVSERLNATGYPLDIRERYPAAVSGELARETNSGALQVAMSVNPGNSGGPVIDNDGNLVGLISQRGEPRAGVEGVVLLEPLRFILPAYARATTVRREQPTRFDESDAVMARIVADFVRTADDRPIFEQTSTATIRMAVRTAQTPEAKMVVAVQSWNMHIALLEARRVRSLDDLAGADRRLASALRRTATRLALRAYEAAPYLRIRFPVMRGIIHSNGRSFVAATR